MARAGLLEHVGWHGFVGRKRREQPGRLRRLSHTTTEPESLPVNSPIGTVVVVTVPCSAHASRARSQT